MQATKRPRGTGSIYRRPGSKLWWVKYYEGGLAHREPSYSASKRDAQKLLNKRLDAIRSGDFIGPEAERVRVVELAESLLADYRINGKSVAWAERCWRKHLEPFFGVVRAVAVSTDRVNGYVERRRSQSASNATINRELSVLQRMFSLAYQAHPRKVARPLTFRRLAENAPRRGFVEDSQYDLLCQNCRALSMRAMLALGYSFGFRKGELLDMRVRQVDLLARTITLDPGTTKNDEGRMVKMTEEVYRLLVECVRGKQADDCVFTRMDGQPVRDFRGAWARLTKVAGLPGLLFHDLRRSAVRNMVRAGVPEVVAMRISGHKTRSVFDRYNIVSESDLAEAARRIEQGRAAEFGHSSGTVERVNGRSSLEKSNKLV